MNDTTLNISYLAKLAQIAINEDQTRLLRDELSDILAMIDQLQQINTDDIMPLANPLDQNQP